MSHAQNGWPVIPDTNAGRRKLVDLFPSVAPHRVYVLAGDVATIARWHVAEYHRRVEPIKVAGCWGWDVRKIGIGPDWSNHAAACAWDLNAPDNPDGTPTRKVMTAVQIGQCHALEHESDGVLRWGGDWADPDAMHWEIVGTPAQAAALARKIKIRNEEEQDMTQDQLLDALESPRGKAALRNALTEQAYGPVNARESIAGRIANIDSKIDGVATGVQQLVAALPPEPGPPAMLG